MKRIVYVAILVGLVGSWVDAQAVQWFHRCVKGYWTTTSSGSGSCSPTDCVDDGQSCPDVEGCSEWKNSKCRVDILSACTSFQYFNADPPKLECNAVECEIEPGVWGYRCRWDFVEDEYCSPVAGGWQCN